MLVIVAAYAAGITTEHVRNRYVYCKYVAKYYETRLAKKQELIQMSDRLANQPGKLAQLFKSRHEEMRAGYQKEADELERQMRRFERAAFLPWTPVPEGPDRIARPSL
jgi:hypothetical protein